MVDIRYIKGDATRPVGTGPKIIVHCCNNIGAWGAGFVLALSRRWPGVEIAYRSLGSYELGDVQFVKAQAGSAYQDEIVVANIIGQEGISDGGYRNPSPVRYNAIEQGLRVVAYRATNTYAEEPASIHMPRMGCGLAGGTWDKMEPIIERTLKGLRVTVYDL